jgi:hypothetical protein
MEGKLGQRRLQTSWICGAKIAFPDTMDLWGQNLRFLTQSRRYGNTVYQMVAAVVGVLLGGLIGRDDQLPSTIKWQVFSSFAPPLAFSRGGGRGLNRKGSTTRTLIQCARAACLINRQICNDLASSPLVALW